MSKINPFHLAVPVDNLEASRKFYRDVMNCQEGRSDTQWVDFDFYGHQLVIHEVPQSKEKSADHNPVDGHEVPVPHFGVVLDWEDWHSLAERLQKQNIEFIIEPYIRFQGKPGEQATMFFKDPAGNALEFKAFKDITQLFAK
jgi:extradiol dioxygenase family protein